MDIREFTAGTIQKGYEYTYFLPNKINHEFSWSNSEISVLLEKASRLVGELNSFSRFVPDTKRFILMHIYHEAVVSSRIEGTQTNIEEALAGEEYIAEEMRDDHKEVINYVAALNEAIEKLKTLPLSIRLIREVHKTLLRGNRGEKKNPGEIRRSQNWIGGTSPADAVFTPPIHSELPDLLSDFEKFLHNTEINVPHLIKIAIAHYQFESLHPFLDGNGRIGRLIIVLYLVSNGILDEPLLYLSDYFEKNKGLYYDNLTFVREKNDLEQWIKFFLVGVITTAEMGIRRLNDIIDLKNHIMENCISKMGKRAELANIFLQKLFENPIIRIKDVHERVGISDKAARNLVDVFMEYDILNEITGGKRNKVYSFGRYLALFK